MSGNSFGTLYCVTSFGESHGPAYGGVVDGCPPGLALSAEEIQKELAKEGCERTFGLLASNRIRSALDVQCSKSRQPTEQAGVGGSA